MISLTLDVEVAGFLRKRKVLRYNGREVRVPPELEAEVARLSPGRVDAGCEYRVGGLILVQLRDKTVALAPDPPKAEKAWREEDPEARRALDAIGEKELSSAAHVLARDLEQLLEQEEYERAAKVFPILLDAAKRNPSMPVDPPNLGALRDRLPRAARKANAKAWIDWLLAHREMIAADHLVSDVPVEEWPPELVARGLAWYTAVRRESGAFREMLANLRERAPDHPAIAASEAMLVDLSKEGERQAAAAAARREQHRQGVMDVPARVDTLEMGFGVALPRELARAWRAGDARLRPLGSRTLRQLLDEGETARARHLADDRAPAFLAIGEREGALLGLYLAMPRPDGDFAVLALEAGKEPLVVASSTREFLA